MDRAVNGLKRGQVWEACDVTNLALAKDLLKKLIRQYGAGEVPITAVYDVFNRRVLRGMPVWFFDETVDKYARANVHQLCEKQNDINQK